MVEEQKALTAEEIQELRSQGLAPQSQVATRLFIVFGVLVSLVVVVQQMADAVGSASLGLEHAVSIAIKAFCVTSGVTLVAGLLAPFLQRMALMQAALLKPRLRPFADVLPASTALFGVVVASIVALVCGYRWLGVLFVSVLGAGGEPVAGGALAQRGAKLGGLGASVAGELWWLALFCFVGAISAALIARQRFLRGHGRSMR
jgi:hypothetical protein